MKKNEIIELNGEEYTLELNRDSFLKIDQYCNIKKSMEIINRGFYDYINVITDDTNPFATTITDEDIEKEIKLKADTLNKMVEVSFWIWLYPNHKLSISKVKEIVKPYLEEPDKSKFIGEKVGEYLNKCIEIRDNYNQQAKNLKAQVNK